LVNDLTTFENEEKLMKLNNELEKYQLLMIKESSSDLCEKRKHRDTI